ncbi:hypothetical protein U1Q18_013040 [Sarracenia purpurea var. burkii]
MKSLEEEIQRARSGPTFNSVRMLALEARNQRLKGLNPVKVVSSLRKKNMLCKVNEVETKVVKKDDEEDEGETDEEETARVEVGDGKEADEDDGSAIGEDEEDVSEAEFIRVEDTKKSVEMLPRCLIKCLKQLRRRPTTMLSQRMVTRIGMTRKTS